jgi:tetratricopeptide (TPR) repeat protein
MIRWIPFSGMRLRSQVLAIAGAVLVLGAALAAGLVYGLLPGRLLRSAEAAMSRGRMSLAAKNMTLYVKLRPNDAQARLLLARCLIAGGPLRAAEAVQHLERVDDRAPEALDAKVRAAEILLVGLNRPGDAERLLRQVLEREPAHFEAVQGLYHIHWWEARKTDELMGWIERIGRSGSLKQRLTALTQQFWIRYGDVPTDLAAPMMQQFLRVNPGDYGARLGWARCLDRLKRTDEAIALWRGCLAERPDDAVPRITLIEYALAGGDWKTARDLLESWPESARNLSFWALRGEYLQQGEGRAKEAADCFERVIQQRPDRWSARYRLSQCLHLLGQRDRAEAERKRSDQIGKSLLVTRVQQLLEEVIPTLESRPQGCYQLASFYDEVGLPAEAGKWRKIGQEMESQPTAGMSSAGEGSNSGS